MIKQALWWLKQIALGFWCAPRDVFQWLTHTCAPVEVGRAPCAAHTIYDPDSGEVIEFPGVIVALRCDECGKQTSKIMVVLSRAEDDAATPETILLGCGHETSPLTACCDDCVGVAVVQRAAVAAAHPEGVVHATLRDIANGILDGGPEGGLGAPPGWEDHLVTILREVYDYGRTGKMPPHVEAD